MPPSKRRHQKEPPSEQPSRTEATSPSPKRHQRIQGTSHRSAGNPHLPSQQRGATPTSPRLSSSPLPEVAQADEPSTLTPTPDRETSSNMDPPRGQESRNDDDEPNSNRRSRRIADIGTRGRRPRVPVDDDSNTALGRGTADIPPRNQDPPLQQALSSGTPPGHMSPSTSFGGASTADTSHAVERLSLEDPDLWGGISEAEMRRQISMLTAMERRIGSHDSSSTPSPQLSTSAQVRTNPPHGSADASPGTPDLGFFSPPPASPQTFGSRRLYIPGSSNYRVPAQQSSHTSWRHPGVETPPGPQSSGGSGPVGTSSSSNIIGGPNQNSRSAPPVFGYTGPAHSHHQASFVNNPTIAGGIGNSTTQGAINPNPLPPSGFSRGAHEPGQHPATNNPLMSAYPSPPPHHISAFEELRQYEARRSDQSQHSRPPGGSIFGPGFNTSQGLSGSRNSSTTGVSPGHPPPLFPLLSFERSHSEPTVRAGTSPRPTPSQINKGKFPVDHYPSMFGPIPPLPRPSTGRSSHSRGCTSSSHFPGHSSRNDRTFRYSNSKGYYEANVPAAYFMNNPNTKPLSTTDPFFKNYPSDPNEMIVIGGGPGAGAVVVARQPTPEIRLDEPEKESERRSKQAQKKQDWKKRKPEELDRFWHHKYRSRPDVSSDYMDYGWDDYDDMDPDDLMALTGMRLSSARSSKKEAQRQLKALGREARKEQVDLEEELFGSIWGPMQRDEEKPKDEKKSGRGEQKKKKKNATPDT
ncbi:hypothetical protein TWF696_005710 [Orbilia brochopaga]|uniref:Uncharacterized protein n=1 Tax=Orbilia brochopaga TaxID=3140254 RepID=A0AAV9UTX9_9PEZI